MCGWVYFVACRLGTTASIRAQLQSCLDAVSVSRQRKWKTTGSQSSGEVVFHKWDADNFLLMKWECRFQVAAKL